MEHNPNPTPNPTPNPNPNPNSMLRGMFHLGAMTCEDLKHASSGRLSQESHTTGFTSRLGLGLGVRGLGLRGIQGSGVTERVFILMSRPRSGPIPW